MTDIVIASIPTSLANRFITCWASFHRSVAFFSFELTKIEKDGYYNAVDSNGLLCMS